VFCYFRLFSVFFRFHFFKKKLSTVFHTLQPLIGILFFIKSRLLSVLFEYRMLFFGVLRISLLSSSRASHTLPCKLLCSTLGSSDTHCRSESRGCCASPHMAALGRTWPHMAAHGRTWPLWAPFSALAAYCCTLLHIAECLCRSRLCTRRVGCVRAADACTR